MRHLFFKAVIALAGLSCLAIAHADPVLLFAAGGGGGSGRAPFNSPGQSTTSGAAGSGANAGSGGANGLGGAGGAEHYGDNGAGGAGWLGSGAAGQGALSGSGGTSGGNWAGGAGVRAESVGGYGGGGGGGQTAGGGGGGFSGGGGGDGGASYYFRPDAYYGSADGGGGGSYIATEVTNAVSSAGMNGSTTSFSDGIDGFITIDDNPFAYTGATADWFAPDSRTYHFVVAGAQGGGVDVAFGGYGAELTGDLYLTAGTELAFVIGGGGKTGSGSGGGGGGTFVYELAAGNAVGSTVPEPTTLALLGLGIAGIARGRRARTSGRP